MRTISIFRAYALSSEPCTPAIQDPFSFPKPPPSPKAVHVGIEWGQKSGAEPE